MGFGWIRDGMRWSAGAVLAVPGVPTLLGTPVPRVLIPYYHRVYAGDGRSLYQLGIHRDRFRRQLRDLQRRYRFVPLDEALEAGVSGAVRHRLAALTFDDGYRDNLTTALPVLQELRIPATIFLVTGLIGRDERLWYDQVKAVCAAAPGPSLALPREIGGGSWPIPDEAARKCAVQMLLDRMKELDDATRRAVVARVIDSVDPAARRDDGSDSLLSWDEARAMESQGIRFGSHTVTHPLLTQIRDRAVLTEELTASRRALEENLAHPLPVLAFPGGANSREVRAAAREAGYQWALGNRPGPIGPTVDRFCVPRRGFGPRSSSLGGRHSGRVLDAEITGLADRLRGRGAPPPESAAGAVVARQFDSVARQIDSVARQFDSVADAYRSSRGVNPAYTGERRRLLEFLPERPGVLLEAGCGSGDTAVYLAAAGWQVIATDLSHEMLRRARAAAEESGVRLRGTVRCDFQRLPFRESCADVLLAHGVLEYLPDQAQALTEARRALRPGGAALVTVPNRLSPASRAAAVLGLIASARRRLRGVRTPRVPARHRRPGELDRIAAAVGLWRRGGIVQTFALLPVYLFPRPWLALNNRLMERLPRCHALRWWGTQYIARYDRPAEAADSGLGFGVDRLRASDFRLREDRP